MGIHRRTRCNVVDNSALGKEAHTSGKRAYCIDVYKQGRRQKHLPHAVLGDKVRVLESLAVVGGGDYELLP